MTSDETPPGDEMEIVHFGPGYWENVAAQFGYGDWAVVGSFLNPTDTSAALRSVDEIGVRPATGPRISFGRLWGRGIHQGGRQSDCR